MEITQEQLDGLRKLRLHHWKGACTYSARCDELRTRMEKVNTGRAADRISHAKKASLLKTASAVYVYQMQQVQFLNSFFPIGDTAEKDASK